MIDNPLYEWIVAVDDRYKSGEDVQNFPPVPIEEFKEAFLAGETNDYDVLAILDELERTREERDSLKEELYWRGDL